MATGSRGLPSSTAVTRLRLFGGFRLEHGSALVATSASGQRLLAYLGICGPASRSVVAGTLWPDVAEGQADGSLRTAIWRLRRGAPRLVERHADVLHLDAAVQVDTHAFAEAALRILDTDAVSGTCAQGGTCAGSGEEASQLGGGELLPGWYDDWVLFERERLRQLRLHALEAVAARLAARVRYAAALEAALESVRIEPLRESAHRVVVAVHLAEGNTAEAVRHYRMFRAMLADELGVEPSRRFTAMLPPDTLSRQPGGGSGGGSGGGIGWVGAVR